MEMAEQKKQAQVQRLEMADNGKKRTRHPFSGYTQILNYDRTTPIPTQKMRYRGPKPTKFATSMEDRDSIMGGVNPRDPNDERPRRQRRPPPPPAPPQVLPAEVRQLRGFQQPMWDNNIQDYRYTTLTAEGQEMIERWQRDYGREYRNHPNKVQKFAEWLISNLQNDPGNANNIYNYLLGIGNFNDMVDEDDD